MTEDLREIAAYELPYRRKAELKEFTYDSGMKILRLVLREGHRITQVELDADTAAALADAMGDWARAQG
ncbi:DUF6967 family protein [Maritimibacter fusiformis]|uniref:Uncharacterized protein n=1 Tax=Maritimibacter fusiformis TaxID=2603819 RepID=A0A5D0R831_9RHOB|nr:hypothetical protein [Maritimibacter fusiformis]TYB77662.1 hypothetical protein FVF75_15500 [Maritimibacter fusiformis]